MNTELFDDLKQFIDSRLSQTETRLDKRIDNLEIKLTELRTEMHDGFAGVADTLEDYNKHFDERVTRLEQQTA